jgi:hypothetical protein
MCNSYESRSVSARAESYKKVRKQIKKKKFLLPHVFWDPGSGINIPDPQHWFAYTHGSWLVRHLPGLLTGGQEIAAHTLCYFAKKIKGPGR